MEIYTDNNPLLYVLLTDILNITGQRWANEHYNTNYKPGRNEFDADNLSRFIQDISQYTHRSSKEGMREISSSISTKTGSNPTSLFMLNQCNNLQKEELEYSRGILKALNIFKSPRCR